MVSNLAKRAMTTEGQKASAIIDHLVEALGNEPSSSMRRALILADIDQYPGTTQAGIMERLGIHKSAVNREIDWLFNYGCIRRGVHKNDARAIVLEVYGYAKTAFDGALDYFDGNHELLKEFILGFEKIISQEKPTLRDAKIIATLYEKKKASKQDVISTLYDGAPSTSNRALNKMIENGTVREGDNV